MIPWWLWMIPIFGTLAFLWLLQKRPTYYRHVSASGLQVLVSQFVRRPVNGSVMVLERENAPGVLQLMLVTNGSGGHALQFGIPDVNWSNEAFDTVESTFRAAGYELRVEKGGTCATVRRYLKASIPGDARNLAEDGTRMLAIGADTLGWGAETRYTVHYERVARNPTTVDT
jgi:hypothetical protein